MEILSFSYIVLIVTTLFSFLLLHYINKHRPVTQTQKYLSFTVACILIISVGLIVEKPFVYLFNVDPINFEKFIYIGTCLSPVMFFLMACSFVQSDFNFKKKHILLFLIPFITMTILCTNDYHHLFYEVYSFNLNEMVYGPFAYLHYIYTYGLFLIGIIMILRHTSKCSGFFSNQSLLIVLGVSIPLAINLLGFFNIIEMNVYLTPISFSFAIFFFYLAIFQFDFLNLTPIALEKIVDRMSDSYIVLDSNNIITDFNKSFLSTFKVKEQEIRNTNVLDWEKKINLPKLEHSIESVTLTPKTVSFEAHINSIHKYFTVEVSSIINKGNFIGTLILFKDITQHVRDLETIKSNQDTLIEKERFASLGQMIGGIAHNLKTPIMSISGATEALKDLVSEYEASIGDPEVTIQDHHEIAKDMYSWISKIQTHTSYMSDVITTVKGQAVETTDSVSASFTIEELIKRINILMKHELKHSLVKLNTELNVDNNLIVHGDVNCLVQVIDNLISNAIQSYGGAPDNKIDFSVDKSDTSLVFSVRDYGSGMSDEVQNKLFKEMVTTKGKNGTGLGLFMSYSNIKAHFNGTITFKSELGKGSLFNIIIPCKE